MKYVLSVLLAFAIAGTAPSAQPTASVFVQYDGYVKQPNGGYVLGFGYYNQNNVDLTIEPGDANRFAPGPPDRNQPVKFTKGRHRFSCAIVVDRGFDGKLQWSVAFAGKTSTTTAKVLDPLYELELNSQKRLMAGLDVAAAPRNVCVNRAPAAHAISPLGEPLETLAARAGQELPIAGQVEDDGLPRGSSVVIAWKKISGPGDVTFSSPSTAATRATFSAPGEYQIELSATDGEKSTSTKITVEVSSSGGL
jgi:K319-like protein